MKCMCFKGYIYDISHDLLAAQLFMFSLVCLNNEMLKEIVLCFKEIDDPFSKDGLKRLSNYMVENSPKYL